MARRNADPMSRQQKAALTRKTNNASRKRYVQGFMSGYLLGLFDAQHGTKRTEKGLRGIAQDNATAGLDD